MKTTEITIGDATIVLDYVTFSRARKEEDVSGEWITGEASLTWTATVGGIHYSRSAEVSVGCWSDTDDDTAEWCAANEGARAIESCIRGEKLSEADTRGSFVRMAFPMECGELGGVICAALRREKAKA